MPYKAGALLSVVLGSGFLYSYFIYIEYVPTNLPSMLALAGLVAAFCIAALMFLTFSLFGTVATMSVCEVKGQPAKIIFFAQLWPMLILLSHSLGGVLAWVSAVTGIVLGGFTLHRQWNWARDRKNKYFLLTIGAPAFGGLLVFSASTFLLKSVGAGSSVNWLAHPAASVLFIGAFFILNAVLAHPKLPTAGVGMFALYITAVLMLFVPERGLLSRTVATKLGLRSSGVVQLRVPVSTCRLISAALTSPATADAADPFLCTEGVNRISAGIDMRWGDRWLISARSVNGRCVATHMRRLTIPEAGTELVLPERGARGSPDSCADVSASPDQETLKELKNSEAEGNLGATLGATLLSEN